MVGMGFNNVGQGQFWFFNYYGGLSWFFSVRGVGGERILWDFDLQTTKIIQRVHRFSPFMASTYSKHKLTGIQSMVHYALRMPAHQISLLLGPVYCQDDSQMVAFHVGVRR